MAGKSFEERWLGDLREKEDKTMRRLIGRRVVDDDGCEGVVGIMYADGDFISWPGGNDAAHPNPRLK